MSFAAFDSFVRTADPWWGDDVGFLDAYESVEDLIVCGLKRSLDNAEWSLFETYLFLASQRRSCRYVPVLAEALDRRDENARPGDVLSLLLGLMAASSVPALERALQWRPEWDEYHEVAFKTLDVLLNIDNDEAWRVIESVRVDDRDRVRDIATAQLARRAAGP
ncbi:hypothetical protein AB5J62_19445 [Amycolatopsis sp. cg5]|uniref:hypothetical protein n=1 Tax=Amycolatopsis sp. cg5 TaxID=3238802 RepID=UPI0035254B7F